MIQFNYLCQINVQSMLNMIKRADVINLLVEISVDCRISLG
jgi:hypothetical protein